MSNFPQELIDLFIDFLGSDITSLKACTLVERRWCPRARRTIFSSVKLKLQLDDPGDFEAQCLALREAGINDFMRRLVVQPISWNVAPCVCDLSSILRIIQGFPQLDFLELQSMTMAHEFTTSELSPSIHLSKVLLHCVHFALCTEQTLVSLCSLADSLQLLDCTWDCDSEPHLQPSSTAQIATAQESSRGNTALTISLSCCRHLSIPVLDYLIRRNNALTSLDIACSFNVSPTERFEVGLAAFSRMLESCGERLTYLRIDITEIIFDMYNPYHYQPPDELTLQSCTRLQTFHVRVQENCETESGAWDECTWWYANWLISTLPPNIPHITIGISFRDTSEKLYDDIPDVFWYPLDGTLAESRFRQLRSVMFQEESNLDHVTSVPSVQFAKPLPEIWRVLLTDHFWRTQARGILTFL